jgi:asparagine synthase (glutamine-hydrolysing)
MVGALAAKCRAAGASGFRDNTAFVGILSTQLWHEAFTGLGEGNQGRKAPILEDVL